MGQWQATHGENAAIRSLPIGRMRHEAAGALDNGRHNVVSVPRPVLAAFGVVANEAIERRADVSHFRRKIEQAQEGSIPGHHAQVGIKNSQPLIEQIQAGL